MNKKMNGVRLAALALLGSALSTAALAQGAPSLSRGNVTVDSGVLDALGPPPGATGLYAPSAPAAPTKSKSGKLKSQFLGPSSLGASGTAVPASEPVASAAPKSSFTPPRPASSFTPPTPAPAPTQSAAASPFVGSPPAPAASPFVGSPPSAAPSPFVGSPPSPAATPAPKSLPQTAALPPARTLPPAAAANVATLAFAPDSAELSDVAKQAVAGVIQKLSQSPDMRVKLSAYAAGTPETVSQTRRLSLSRALAVRSYLIDQGVKSTRIDVLALGNQVTTGSADRVDLAVVAQ